MDEYDIPVTVNVSGMINGIRASSLEEAIKIAESGGCFTTISLQQSIEDKPQVVYDLLGDMYPGEPLSDEPPSKEEYNERKD